MLFICRYAGRDSFGIYDTDDQREEVVHRSVIVNAVANHGIQIKGVESRYSDKLHRIVVDDISPYQAPFCASVAQTKLRMLRGVDVKTWDGSITSITFEPSKITEPVRVRLSDFAPKVSDFILMKNKSCFTHKITLVLDDKLWITHNSFALSKAGSLLGPDGLGVVLDVREVNDVDIWRNVYRGVSQFVIIEFDCIIDHASRKAAMQKRWFGQSGEDFGCFS